MEIYLIEVTTENRSIHPLFNVTTAGIALVNSPFLITDNCFSVIKPSLINRCHVLQL